MPPIPLLSSKTRRPVLSTKRVSRPRLVRRLNNGLSAGHLLFLISAPAGFGKTTCAAEWLSGLPPEMPVAWLSLDPADDEPGRFFTYFLSAIENLGAGQVGDEINAVLRSGQVPPADLILAALVNRLDSLETPCLLVLDDLHLIQDPFIFQVLESLVTGPPPALRLLMLTREDPSLPLARLRANNRLTEIRAADLRFSAVECTQFLNQVMELDLAPADLLSLAERTEGWIAGLQLAGLSMRDRPGADRSALIASLSGSHRFILSYLTEEVLNGQPAAVQEFLLKTSLLERMCGPLCDAVVETQEPSQAILADLERANLFIVPLDDEQRWYRYHHLFAGLLRDRLSAVYADQIPLLHRRASAWFRQASLETTRPEEQATFVNQAVEHALQAKDYAAAVSLIEDHTLDMLMQWHTRTVSGWLQAIPPEWSLRSPKANLAFAWSYLLRGPQGAAQAAPYIERLGILFSQTDLAQIDPEVQAEWLALQADLASALGRPEEALAAARQALNTAPPQANRARGHAYTALATGLLQLGQDEQAQEAYQELIRQARAAGDLSSELMGLSALGLMWITQGRLHAAFELASQGEERSRQAGILPPMMMGIYGELSTLYHRWNQLEKAAAYSDRAAQVGALSSFSDAELFQAVIRSQLALRRGDLSAAEAEIAKGAQRMRLDAATVVREEVFSQQVRVFLAQGRLAKAEAALSAGLWPTSPPGRRFQLDSVLLNETFSYAQGSLFDCALRVLIYRARHGMASPEDFSAGLRLAEDLIAACEKRHYLPIQLETLVLKSQVQAERGDLAAGLAGLARAVELAEPEGMINLFIEEGAPLAELLSRLLADGSLPPIQAGFARGLLAAFPQDAPGPSIGLPEQLSDRELDVLRLIAEGLTYAQITARLYISLNTVRTHVKNIYGKLGVNNRTQAIEAARKANTI